MWDRGIVKFPSEYGPIVKINKQNKQIRGRQKRFGFLFVMSGSPPAQLTLPTSPHRRTLKVTVKRQYYPANSTILLDEIGADKQHTH